jgi:ribosome maturation factor RimP
MMRRLLSLRYRRPKLVGKGKEDVVEDKEILYSDIKKALIVIKF